MSLEEEMSKENVLAYAKCCTDVADYLSLMADQNIGRVLIPSRGTVPIFRNAYRMAKILGYDLPDAGVTILPFTADYAEKDAAESIRSYWVKTFKGMMDKTNPELLLYDHVLRNIAKVGSGADAILKFGYGYYIHGVKHGKTITIDTVISGQSACNIMQAMEKEGLDFFSILIVDKNGEKLKPDYGKYLKNAEQNCKCVLLYTPRIYTEDRGPSLLGMTSIVYPTLMREAGKKLGYVPGVGFFSFSPHLNDESNKIPITRAQEYAEAMIYYATLLNTIEKNEFMRPEGILEMIRNKTGVNPKEAITELFESYRESLIQVLKKYDLMNPGATKEEFEPLIKRHSKIPSEVHVTSSHVIQVHYSEKESRNFIQEYERRKRNIIK